MKRDLREIYLAPSRALAEVVIGDCHGVGAGGRGRLRTPARRRT